MKTEKRAEIITEKINKIMADKSQVIATYRVRDDSVQAQLRLSATWIILMPVDAINYPKDLSGKNSEVWNEMWLIAREITKTAELKTGTNRTTISINERTKSGPARRAEAKSAWMIEAGTAFLADYRAVTGKRYLASIRKTITELQAQQKALIPKLRQSNSAYLGGKKSERELQKTKNAEALKSGRFWEADKDTLKGYFHPPFDKNYLADVSEKWRAALFLECESVSYKRYSGDWGHKLSGTGRGYLCGIDDNGDEWGHRIDNLPQSRDNYGDAGLDSTVEEAMSDLFDISLASLTKCRRQGDLLFCPVKIPTEDREICDRCGAPKSAHHDSVETSDDGQHQRSYLACDYRGNFQAYDRRVIKAPILTPVDTWTPRESHEITSSSLKHNGRYFRAGDEITVSHTSHAMLTLPRGEYRLYMSRVADPVD